VCNGWSLVGGPEFDCQPFHCQVITVGTLFTHMFLCLDGAVVERWTRDRKVAGSTPGRGDIKSTRSTQPSIPTG